MKKDEFELINNPILILGGRGDDDIPSDDDEKDNKDERSRWQKFWDWALGRNNGEK